MQMPKERKSQEERQRIVQSIKDMFQTTLGVDVDTYDSRGFQIFAALLREYSDTPDLTSGFSGKIFVEEINRYLHYILPVSLKAKELVRLSVMDV